LPSPKTSSGSWTSAHINPKFPQRLAARAMAEAVDAALAGADPALADVVGTASAMPSVAAQLSAATIRAGFIRTPSQSRDGAGSRPPGTRAAERAFAFGVVAAKE
jgi:hypothetical protein